MTGRTNSTFGGAISLPDGDTVTPVNDVQTWLKCAGIKDKTYTTVSQVVKDTNTMFLLMSDENAMKYLARSTGFTDAVCANETFMTLLGQSAYVDATVLNSDIWVDGIGNSLYMDKVFHDLIPAMTSLSCDIGSFTNVQYVDGRTTPWSIFDKICDGDVGTYYQFNNENENSTIREFTFNQSTNIYVIKTVSNGHAPKISSIDINRKGLIELYTFKNNQYTKIAEFYQNQKDIGLEYNSFIVKSTDITKFKIISNSVLNSGNPGCSFALDVNEVYLYGR